MGTARRLFTDEFKREAVELLASSGRPLSQIARELGIAASRLRAWRTGVTGGRRDRCGAPIRRRRSRLQARIWPPRMPACGARTNACAWSGRS
ncbi:MAG: transposase [Methylocella sp.]